ncbi:hypothetical protein WICPIJ_001306 [Wickerhamomyces pijperi]|uniref:Uncharacterized protein n=1 Tax=Wickerhamomyces pijperi TaxID=599730 RepID=A0A9P8QB13_WICPI|nr:hypothetical protein WICPIJ_001306 [Wickerhamomyces pijperi]
MFEGDSLKRRLCKIWFEAVPIWDLVVSISNSSSDSSSTTQPVLMFKTSNIPAVVPPNIITVNTTTTRTVANSVLLNSPWIPMANATPTAPLSPAQNVIIWYWYGISSGMFWLPARVLCAQLITLESGKTAHHLATQMEIVVTMINIGLYTNSTSVKSARPNDTAEQQTDNTRHVAPIGEEIRLISDQKNKTAFDLWISSDMGMFQNQSDKEPNGDTDQKRHGERHQEQTSTFKDRRELRVLPVELLTRLKHNNGNSIVQQRLTKDNSV